VVIDDVTTSATSEGAALASFSAASGSGDVAEKLSYVEG
jgi:hypothetical protein